VVGVREYFPEAEDMNRTQREAEILAIAEKLLGLKTLEPRHSDDLDFYNHSVWQVREALEAAYDAGYRAAGGIIADGDE
jgi:hypothetical protein